MTKKRKFERPDYKEYINSYEWNRKRVKAFYVLGKRCEVCGSSKNIHVHHNNYGSLGNEKPRADLVILCKECHKELHLLVPTNSLGKRSVGYTKGHRCTLCMDSNQYKKTKYLSCGLSTQLGHSWKNPKPKAHRILHICERCLEAVGPRLLEENKITNSMKKKMLREKTETKKKKRLLRLKAKKEKAKLPSSKIKKVKKSKKPKKPPLSTDFAEVVVLRQPGRKTT